MIVRSNNPNSWRHYQNGLKKKARRRSAVNRVMLLFVYMVLMGATYTASWILAQGDRGEEGPLTTAKWQDIQPEKFGKQDLPSLLDGLNLKEIPATHHYSLDPGGMRLAAEVPIDTRLQQYILNLLRRSLTHQAAVVVLKPQTGQILAMADYKKVPKGEGGNLCLKADFPAASLFKIISAAAAIEARGFTPSKTVVFRGMKHTLYNSQLRQKEGRYSRKTSFRRAFAGSINPVFGKIGIYDLGRKYIEEYADRFLFNHEIPFDLPVGVSHISIPADNFGLAEIASGFNKRTRISPVHASLITAGISNRGIIIEPWLVRRIRDESGAVLYRARFSRLARPIEEGTAEKLKVLMKETVLYGTCRKAFLPLRRKKRFKDIELGAKTGTINDPNDRYKYDWVTAYALPKDQTRGICVTILAVHGKKLGIRAADMAMHIIRHHFRS
ncbi:MAG: penicillin-binding transpeptidase domain-containing protein [Desulfobacteraceae bacterium]